MNLPSRVRLTSLWACTALLVAACGGDDNPAPTPPAPPPAGGTDTTAPTANLTGPVNLAVVRDGTLTLAATASDNVGVAAVEFQIDGIPVGAADTTAPYEASLTVFDHPPGQHVVRARARDAAGNVSAWSSATVRLGPATAPPAADPQPARVPPGFTLANSWVTGLNNATAMVQAPDGRLFVTQQTGAVRVVKNGALLPTPFVDLTAATDGNGERGAIGITLHPDFATNGWVYVHYTATAGGAHGRISRFTANGDVAAAGSEQVLVDLPVLGTATNHNGGAIHFGTDGKLYVGVGDNADRDRAPRLTDVFGKLLRFNDDGSIPTDNPHYGTQTGLARSIWARGLRNPFTFAVQPGTGAIYINDVGENTWEEINVGAAGADFGWPASEGPTTNAGATTPLFAYNHAPASPVGSGPGGFFTGIAVAGGTFYPATGAFPAPYRNNYFFADLGGRYIGRLDPANGNAATTFAWLSNGPVDLMAGHDGALYVLYRNVIARITAP